MSESKKMYAMKPIVDFKLPVELTSAMYKMRNFHEPNHQNGHHSSGQDSLQDLIDDKVTDFLKEPLPNASALVLKQEEILDKLSRLQQQIFNICDRIKPTNCPIPRAEVIPGEPVNVQAFLTTSPKNRPFSILALSKLWSDSVFQIQTHIHSTFTGTVPEFVPRETEHTPEKNVIDLKIIWKDVPDVQLKLNLKSCTILGEVNFLRYLCRSIEMHNYENSDPMEANLINSVLDLCHVLPLQSPKEAQETISNLGNHLKEGPWLLNKKEPTIADVAAWSVIKRLNSKLPTNLAKWFENCEKMFL